MFTAWSEIEYLATKRLQSLVLITTEYGDIFETCEAVSVSIGIDSRYGRVGR